MADKVVILFTYCEQVSLELDHEEEGDSEKSVVKPLLHLKITGIMADVKNRSWDTSAAISVTDIVIFDHITLGKDFSRKEIPSLVHSCLV